MNKGRHSNVAASYLFLASCFLLLASCSSSGDTFRLEGRFRNMNQGELYIYDAEQGCEDTIHVSSGRFEYQRSMDEPALLMLMFPNFSELPILAAPGVSLTVKGDATHLRDTEIKGDAVNKEMTDFRLNTNEQTPPDQQQVAANYIADHPESPIAPYLLRRHFLDTDVPDYPRAYALCQTIAQAQPDNVSVATLAGQLEAMKECVNDGPLPHFSARDTKGRTVDNSQLRTQVGVILLWASWNYESQNMLRTLHRKQLDHKGRLSVVTICIDAGSEEGRKTLERDSIDWPNVCDGQMWQSPLLAQLGLFTIGANIIVDEKGTIVARNLDNGKLAERLDRML